MISEHTTVAIERTALRLLGVNGAVKQASGWFPEANLIVDGLRKNHALGGGVLRPFVNGMIQKKMPAPELGHAVASGKVALEKVPRAGDAEIASKARELCSQAVKNLVEQREKRDG